MKYIRAAILWMDRMFVGRCGFLKKWGWGEGLSPRKLILAFKLALWQFYRFSLDFVDFLPDLFAIFSDCTLHPMRTPLPKEDEVLHMAYGWRTLLNTSRK